MTFQQLYLILIIFWTVSSHFHIHAQQTAITHEQTIKNIADEPEQKPTQRTLKMFFDTFYGEHSNLSPALNKFKRTLVWKLLHKYGKNIINESLLPSYENRILFDCIVYEDWTAKEFEELLQIPGIDITSTDHLNLYTPLTKAMHFGDSSHGDPSPLKLKKLELLIRYGANVRQRIVEERLHLLGPSPLTHAVRLNQSQVVLLLLQEGASIGDVIIWGTDDHIETFFDLVNKYPSIRQAYDHYQLYKQNIITQATETLSGIAPLGNIVGEYLFPAENIPLPQPVMELDGEEKEKEVADSMQSSKRIRFSDN